MLKIIKLKQRKVPLPPIQLSMLLGFEGVRWNKTKLNNYILKFMHRILHAIKLKRFCDVQKNIVKQNRIKGGMRKHFHHNNIISLAED